MWDVFISHASEDKDSFVRPLADRLHEFGVKIWYDEFELKMGDSLSESIDRGLKESNYGIIVFSPKFFEKNWADYELKSLVSKQLNGKRIILPIWYRINKDEIQKYSLYLSDIKALSAEKIDDIVIENILRVIRPDILNSNLLLEMGVKLYKNKSNMERKIVPLDKIDISPIRHQVLPVHMVIATRLISEVFSDVLNTEYQEMIINFARDLDYDHEFIIWSAMANSYVAFIRDTGCSFSDIEKKKEAISILLDYNMTGNFYEDGRNLKKINKEEYSYLIESYITNYEHLMKMVEKYS